MFRWAQAISTFSWRIVAPKLIADFGIMRVRQSIWDSDLMLPRTLGSQVVWIWLTCLQCSFGQCCQAHPESSTICQQQQALSLDYVQKLLNVTGLCILVQDLLIEFIPRRTAASYKHLKICCSTCLLLLLSAPLVFTSPHLFLVFHLHPQPSIVEKLHASIAHALEWLQFKCFMAVNAIC